MIIDNNCFDQDDDINQNFRYLQIGGIPQWCLLCEYRKVHDREEIPNERISSFRNHDHQCNALHQLLFERVEKSRK